VRTITFTLEKREYVILPKEEYQALTRAAPAKAGRVTNAVTYAARSLARDLRLARKSAGLTQADLARRLGRSQAMVSAAEHGRMRVGARFVAAVLAACGLPEDWKPSRRAR
jgi:ribosome-binding protein aMBF1 (putative translation factor)